MIEDPDTSGLSELELQTLATQYACDEVERLTRENEELRKQLADIARGLGEVAAKLEIVRGQQ